MTVRHVPTQRVSLERPRLHLAAVLPCVCQCDDLSLLLAPPPLAGAPLACLPHTAKDPAVVAPAQSYVVERVLAVVAGNEFDETHNAGRHCCRSAWQRWNQVVGSGRYSCKSRLTFSPACPLPFMRSAVQTTRLLRIILKRGRTGGRRSCCPLTFHEGGHAHCDHLRRLLRLHSGTRCLTPLALSSVAGTQDLALEATHLARKQAVMGTRHERSGTS